MANHPERFFTYWALAAHIFYILGIFPNTFLLAVFVLIGSIFHNLFLCKKYSLVYDFILHILPVVVFITCFATRIIPFNITLIQVMLPFVMFSMYLVTIGGLDRCLEYYREHVHYFYND